MNFAELPHGRAALAIFPSVEGFGWMLFDGPLSPVRWGVSTMAKRERNAKEKNDRCIGRAEAILDEFRPGTLVLEEFDSKQSRRHARIRQLGRSLVALAATLQIPVRLIRRDVTHASFPTNKGETRYEVAEIAASYLKEIKHQLPRKRRFWETEDAKMALFNATALLIVHYANPTEPLAAPFT